MSRLPDNSIDLILCDLPYGTTACLWDAVIPFEPLWAAYNRVAKRSAAMVFTASQPFTTTLIASNMKAYRYNWVWEKNQGVNFLNAKHQPLKIHEDIVVFYRSKATYSPQMTVGSPYVTSAAGTSGDVTGNLPKIGKVNSGTRYPTTVQKFKREFGLHPTQKPVALMRYLIETYSMPGDIILDPCMGSGTTGVAARDCGRGFVGIERDQKYFDIAEGRIAA